MYKIVIIDTLQKWQEISSPWNELVEQSNSNTIFLTWEWLHTWSECFCTKDRRLFILAIYQKDELIGIAPWCVRFSGTPLFELRRIEFLGSPEMGSDYLDVFVQKGKEEEVARRIYHYLFGEASHLWDTILLRDIPSDSLFLLYFMEQARTDGKYITIREGAFCPIVNFPGSWDDLFKSLSSNRREQFRRHYRSLKKHGNVKHETLIRGMDGGPTLDRFISLYKSWWGKTQDQGFYDHLKTFFIKCQMHSRIQFDFLTINEKDVGAFMHFRYDGTLFMYLMAVDKAFDKKISIGNILVGLCLENAISDGIAQYDFLRGNEKYKFHWSNGGRRSLVLQLYQRRLSVLGYLSLETLKNFGKIILR